MEEDRWRPTLLTDSKDEDSFGLIPGKTFWKWGTIISFGLAAISLLMVATTDGLSVDYPINPFMVPVVVAAAGVFLGLIPALAIRTFVFLCMALGIGEWLLRNAFWVVWAGIAVTIVLLHANW